MQNNERKHFYALIPFLKFDLLKNMSVFLDKHVLSCYLLNLNF